MRRLSWLVPWFVQLLLGCIASAQNTSSMLQNALSCNENGVLCTEAYDSVGYEYTGHDEPSLLFYSKVPGSGNTGTYYLRLPKDPPTLPKQDGTGGAFNFQLRPAFWVGMAMCDSQSAPNPNSTCTPDSDRNIFDGSDPTKPDYIGNHPGTAFMEMQFYPPGWLTSCDLTNRWCSALTIDSFSQNQNTGQFNNSVCENAVGDEPVNFAFITKSGVPVGPPSPLLRNGSTFTPTTDTLFYNPGDLLRIVLRDTTQGLRIAITDLTSGERGSMTASATNGFAQVLFDPNGTDCNPTTHNLLYDFHAMYATSSEHTRVPWAAHSYNIAFSDEIGHFEYCNAVSAQGGRCTQDGVHDLDNGLPLGAEDDSRCFDAAFASSLGLVPIGGCTSTDFDFDGVPYQLVWPGTFPNASLDRSVHSQPVRFTSPVFQDREGETRNYSRVAFEADLPRIESNTSPPCQRHIMNPADPSPGADCLNPPTGANFYPFFTTTGGDEGENCMWQLGGAHIPGTINNFGGSSTSEFGSLLALAYPAAGGVPTFRYNNFRRVLTNNPCPRGN